MRAARGDAYGTQAGRSRGSADGAAGAALTVLADHAARARITHDLGSTLIVEAAAGTGKTTALVGRIIAALVSGHARLERMVAVTFTDLAAGELKLRLRAEIERARHDPATPEPARARLREALPQLEEARIGTIHSFCADLLRERPVEAGVDPRFAVAADEVGTTLFGRTFARWFEQQLARPGEGVRRVLRRPLRADRGPRALLRAGAEALVEWRDFPAPWRHVPFERGPAIDAILATMADLGRAAAAGEPDDYFTRSLEALGQLATDAARREAVHGRDDDWVEARLVECVRDRHWSWRGFTRAPDGFPKGELLARRDALRARVLAFNEAAGQDLAPKLRDELWAVVEGYEAAKRRAGCLDFLDLLLHARDLVRDHPGVRRELQARFTHVLVDEFQDTDPLQAELLLLLAADDPEERDWQRVRPIPGKLFLVGDPKQSIYRFRRADVRLYESVKRQLVAAGAEVLDLSVSFRAVPEIQEAVNAAFAPAMDGVSSHQARYVPLSPHRRGQPRQPAIVALPVPGPYGDYKKITDWAIERSLPDAVAAFVDWLVHESGWTVTERDGVGRVAVAPRHVCVLFRRFQSFGRDVTGPYVRALEARQVPHLLVGGSSFHAREEVEALRNALAAIERPEDELMVFATLRGPLFAIGDAALLTFRERIGSLHPFRRVPDDASAAVGEVAAALGVLRDLHRSRNRRPLADTIARLLGAVRAPAGLAIWPTGEQALANVGRLLDMARRAERRGITSFRAFVERLQDDALRGGASEAPLLEEGAAGVRLMTVHRAKGLEFPVVVLADPTCNETPRDASRWVDTEQRRCVQRLADTAPAELVEQAAEELAQEAQEAARVLYVAATRARDLLVVSALGDDRVDGWLRLLHPVIHPPAAATPTVAPGCPAFGPETIARRPAAVRRPAGAVAPGEHRAEAGSHRIVWWDPTVLRLEVQESVGLRQRRILEVDEQGVRASASAIEHEAWQRRRATTRAHASEPSLRVEAVTERALAEEGLAADVVVEDARGPGDRPHGKRFGTLVHALLAAVDLAAGGEAIAASAALHGRLLGATSDEVGAAVAAVERTLAHPLLRRAAAVVGSGACRRETPVTLVLDDGVLVEGVVDVAFRDADAGGWIVVDWKTDLELGERLDAYRRQVALYARAIARATGEPVRGVLLRV